MITYCPYCGHLLTKPIVQGITGCNNCNRIFDSSKFHRLLSASWLVRRRHLYSQESLINIGYTHEEVQIVWDIVVEKCYSHQEFVEYLKKEFAA